MKREEKSRINPRYKPPVQTGRTSNPIYSNILKIAKRLGYPVFYKRDLVIDRQAITRKHPSAVIWGVRDTGTEIICLSRGTHKNAPKKVGIFGNNLEPWVKHAIDKIEFWSRQGAASPISWYYVTPSGVRKVTPAEAIKIVKKFSGKWTTY